MKNRKKYKWSIPVMAVVLLFAGCSEDILDKQPLDKLSEESFWQTERDAKAGIAAVYDALEPPFRQLGWGTMGIFDIFTPIGNCRNAQIRAVADGRHDPSHPVPARLWENCYRGVVRANDFLTNIDRIDMDADLKARLTGEARFLRAMYYFMLVDNFGDVPLFETVPTVDDALAERASKADVIALMKEDVEFAINNLKSSYTGNDLGRATIGAATALKVKVALLEKDWGTAADAAEDIMGMGYDLLPNYRDVFLLDHENSVEVIFDVQYIFMNDAEQGGTYEKLYASREAAANGFSFIQPTLFLVDKFEVIDPNPTYEQEDTRIPTEIYDYFEGRDPRMDHTILRPGSHFNGRSGDKIYPYGIRQFQNSNTRMHVRKYVIEGPDGVTSDRDSPLNWIVFRYADILLNYLEAVAERDGIGAVTQTVLDQTINKIRVRASDQLPLYTAGAITMEDIRDERIRELAFEGWLYSDMKRWGTIEMNNGFKVLGLKVTSSTISLSTSPIVTRTFESPKNYLMPIPQGERDINSNLSQNPGYPE